MAKTSNIAIVTKMGALGVLVSLFFFWNPKGFGQISLEGRQMPILPLSGLGKVQQLTALYWSPSFNPLPLPSDSQRFRIRAPAKAAAKQT